MPTFGKNIELKINVLSEDIMFLGRPEEAAGKTLQGKVTMELAEPIKIKAIHLSFLGKVRVRLTEGIVRQQDYKQQEVTVTEKKWTFYKSDEKKLPSWNAGHYSWDFDHLLPGNLPQTFKSKHGKVYYRLKAVVERSSFVQNSVSIKSLRLLRSMLPSEFELMQSLEIQNMYEDMLAYNISIPSKIYTIGDKVPIHFKFVPMLPLVKAKCLMATIKEYSTYKTSTDKKSGTRILRVLPESCQDDTSAWEDTIYIELPSNLSLVYPDIEYDMITVRHGLKFKVSLTGPNGHNLEFCCGVNIIILESTKHASNIHYLPDYEEACGSPHPIIIPTNDTSESSWDSHDLSKVPSYSTLATQRPPSSFPPSYEHENSEI